jgi:hypothetical protein
MKKHLPLLILSFLMAFGIALAYSQSSNELISYGNLNSALSDGTLVATGAGGCNASGQGIANKSYVTTCVLNNGNCFSGTASTYVPTYGAILACKATPGPTATPVHTPAPTPTPTATPLPHTTGLSITDGCLTNNANYATLSGYSISPVYEAVSNVSGSTCSSGNLLDNGGAQQALNHGANINAGTIVTVGADLYGQATSGSVGTNIESCTESTGTVDANALVQLRNSSGTVEAQFEETGNNAWSGTKSVSFTIPTTGVYYIAIISEQESRKLTGSSAIYNIHAGFLGCTTVTITITANAYITGLTVSSS